MAKEGNLEAPTRYPLKWLDDDFYNEDSLNAEMERVFDICHGCRRCVSLCGSFPTLFDLVDDSETMEIDGVKKSDYQKVVDQCYLCDLCYMSKCPYTPPHEWNLDFPHLMLRAKAVNFKKGKVKLRDKVLSKTDTLGSLAGIPVVTKIVNKVNNNKHFRVLLEKIFGIDKNAWLPKFSLEKFKSNKKISKFIKVKNGKLTQGKVAIFATCYVNFYETGIGKDLIAILQHNEIPFVIVDNDVCCGMPKLEQGDLNGVDINKKKNVEQLFKYAEQGYEILTPIPSCTLMFKQEIPLMYPESNKVKSIKNAMRDPFEYLVLRNRDGLLKLDFKESLGNISYHFPCHSRVQNIGKKTVEALSLVPETNVSVVERCSGHAGTFGVKKEFHKMSMKIGKPVFKSMSSGKKDYITSDCQLAGHHINQGIEMLGFEKFDMLHPISLLRKAYSI